MKVSADLLKKRAKRRADKKRKVRVVPIASPARALEERGMHREERAKFAKLRPLKSLTGSMSEDTISARLSKAQAPAVNMIKGIHAADHDRTGKVGISGDIRDLGKNLANRIKLLKKLETTNPKKALQAAEKEAIMIDKLVQNEDDFDMTTMLRAGQMWDTANQVIQKHSPAMAKVNKHKQVESSKQKLSAVLGGTSTADATAQARVSTRPVFDSPIPGRLESFLSNEHALGQSMGYRGQRLTHSDKMPEHPVDRLERMGKGKGGNQRMPAPVVPHANTAKVALGKRANNMSKAFIGHTVGGHEIVNVHASPDVDALFKRTEALSNKQHALESQIRTSKAKSVKPLSTQHKRVSTLLKKRKAEFNRVTAMAVTKTGNLIKLAGPQILTPLNIHQRNRVSVVEGEEDGKFKVLLNGIQDGVEVGENLAKNRASSMSGVVRNIAKKTGKVNFDMSPKELKAHKAKGRKVKRDAKKNPPVKKKAPAKKRKPAPKFAKKSVSTKGKTVKKTKVRNKGGWIKGARGGYYRKTYEGKKIYKKS
jgi:hypothetical protein